MKSMKLDAKFRIDLGEYVITTCPMNFVLNKVITPKKSNKPYLHEIGFFPCLSQACTALLRLELLKSDAKSIQDLLDALQATDELIAKIDDFKHYRI